MAAIKWDEVGDKKFEAGLDRGVLYDPDGIGVAWNGLVSVDEEATNEVESVYFDGLKANDLVMIGEYAANMTAYTYPPQFEPFSGLEEDQRGVFLTSQPQDRFHLSYRTLTGSDVSTLGVNYKIHLVYNLTANVASRSWETLALEVTPMEFEWHITAIPENMDGHRPTAHIIIDSSRMDPWLLEDLEDIIYGNEDNDPMLPPWEFLITWIRKWNRLIIEDHGDGTWSAISQDDAIIRVDVDGRFEIDAADEDVVIIDANTYTIKSSEKNDEDIHP